MSSGLATNTCETTASPICVPGNLHLKASHSAATTIKLAKFVSSLVVFFVGSHEVLQSCLIRNKELKFERVTSSAINLPGKLK